MYVFLKFTNSPAVPNWDPSASPTCAPGVSPTQRDA